MTPSSSSKNSSGTSIGIIDRPNWFWGGLSFGFFVIPLAIVRFLTDSSPLGQGENDFTLGLAMLGLMIPVVIGTNVGFPATLDLATKSLMRRKKLVQDLSHARLVVVYRFSENDNAHIVVVALDPNPKAGSLVAALQDRDSDGMQKMADASLMGFGEHVYFLANGVRRKKAQQIAERFADGLKVPVVWGVGDNYE
jgi:hypothetical protein